MGWWRRFFNGLLSKDKSLATGLIRGFMAWTLMRLVDGIASNASGFDFLAPMIVAGTHVEFEVKYTRPEGSAALPIVRIKPETTKFRLVEPGFSTFVARNQVGLLLALLMIALVMFFLSVAGVPQGEPHA